MVACLIAIGTAENPKIVESSINYVNQHGTLGIFTLAFLAGTVLPFPIEAVVGGAAVLGGNVILLILAATLGHTLGTVVSFYLARFLREPFVYKRVDKKSIRVFNDFWKKYGDWSLFITSVIPILPGDIVAVVAGLSDMNIKKFVFIVSVAKLITYTLVALFALKVASTWFVGII